MKEKFDRTKPHANIGELFNNLDETLEEKRLRIERTKTNIASIPIVLPAPSFRISLRIAINNIIENSLEEIRKQEREKQR